MFQTDRTSARQLFAFTVRDLIDPESDVWLYIDLFDSLDVEEFDADYVSQGQSAKDPRLMLRTILFGLTHGMTSGRKLADACRYDSRYMVLCGDLRPDCRTFHRFLVRHQQRMDALFCQIVRLAQKMGLVKLGRVAIDGSRFKASASKHRKITYAKMDTAIAAINEELTKLRDDLACHEQKNTLAADTVMPREIQRREMRVAKIEAAKAALLMESRGKDPRPEAQKSLADPCALSMGGKSTSFVFGYNAQAVVDAESQIVVAAELHPNSDDSQALPMMLDKVREVCGSDPQAVLADAGYQSAENLRAVEKVGAIPFIAMGCGESLPPESFAEQLIPGTKKHEYLCLAGKSVPLFSRYHDASVLKVNERFCSGCQHQMNCALFQRLGKRLTLPPEDKRRIIVENARRMRSESGRQVYRYRKAIVEPVFGNIKNKGIRILVRGADQVNRWWKLACMAHNIEKIIGNYRISPA